MEKNSNYTQAVWLAISSFSSFALAFVSAAILSRCFDKTEYGTYKQIIYVYGTLQTIFTVGLPGVFSYFIPRYNIHEGKYLVNKINTVFLILGLSFSLSLYFSSGLIADVLKNEELAVGLKIFSVFPLFTLPALGVEGLYTALRKTKYIAIYNTVSKMVMLVCIIIPVLLFDGSYKSAIVGWGVAAFFNFLFAMYMKSKPYLSIRKQTIPKFYSTIFNYSVPLMGASLVGFFIHSSNQFFISRYYGTEIFAEYSNGFISIPFVGMIAGSIRGVLLPIFSKSQNEGSITNAMSSFRSAVDKSIILIYPVILFSLIFAKDIMVLIYGDQYSASASYFRVSLFRDLIDVFPFMSVLLATGYSKIYFRGHFLFAILLLPLSFLLSELSFPPIAIIVLFIVLDICTRIYFFYFLYKKEDVILIPIETMRFVLKIILHLLVVLFVVHIFSKNVLSEIMPLIRITINLMLYYLIILLSQKLFKVNYFTSVLLLLKKKN